MNDEIKQRIAKINNGEIPSGYKKTDFGVFPCDWVTDGTFDDLFSFYGGLGKSREELGDKGIPYLHYGDMHRGTFSFVSYEQYEKMPKYDVILKGNESYLMSDGDIAFLDASEDLQGTSRAVMIENPENKPFAAGLHIILAKEKAKTLNKQYKQYLTLPHYMEKQFQSLAAGFKVYGLNRNTLPRIKVAFPSSKDEQNRIAKILMKWDEALNLQEKMIEALQKQKKYYLSKMFPAKGQNVPEIRFKGFTDAWEQRKLGEILKTIPFKPYLKERETDGKYEIIQQGNEPVIGYASGEPYTEFEDTVIFGDHTLSLYKPKSPFFVATDGVRIIKGKQKTDGYFLFALLEKYRPQSEGYKRYYSILADVEVLTTGNDAEQKAIGLFFENLDNFITLHQRKLEKIQKQQKTMQQLLLTGIVRVEK